MSKRKDFINIGVVAHVDAGKTSITELFLHKSGVINTIGSVDKGTSQTDWLSVEKERGISVRSASASFSWKNKVINLIDTPGHVDFSSEVERSMNVMDCAILVISAAEGVQGHTITLWEALRKLNIPTIIFINKVDRASSNLDVTMADIRKELSIDIIEMQEVVNEGVDTVALNEIVIFKANNSIDTDTIEPIIERDDNLMNNYLEGITLQSELVESTFKSLIHQCSIFPVYKGSAKFDLGINDLLNAITTYMPVADTDNSDSLSGIIYKIEHDKQYGKLAHIRLFGGCIKNRDVITYGIKNESQKVTGVRKNQGNKYYDIDELIAGDTACISGLSNVKAGDLIGSSNGQFRSVDLATPMLKVKVIPLEDADYSALVEAMIILAEEDPTLDLIWLKDERELHIKILGIMQLQILKSINYDRFNLKIEFDKPIVIYKETPIVPFIAFEEYTMPKPCWAVVRFKIEPGQPGSGIVYESEVGVNEIAMRYQQEVERNIPIALSQGKYGWEVTDLKITLIGDEDHNIHSRAGDFGVATSMAIMKGLVENGTTLLEPILEYNIKAEEEKLGVIVSSLTKIRAEIGNPIIKDGKFTLNGSVPVSTSIEYSTKFSSITSGKGTYSASFLCYRECTLEQGSTTPYRGVNPLDRAKFILKARKALS